MKLFKRLVPIAAVTALTALLAGCFEFHASAEMDANGSLTGGSIEMTMAKSTLEPLAKAAETSADVSGFQTVLDISAGAEDAPAVSKYMKDCKYSQAGENFTATCNVKADAASPVTVDVLLGLTGGSSVVEGSNIKVMGTFPDTTAGDSTLASSAAENNLLADITITFPGEVFSVEGAGVTISEDDPNSVVIEYLAASSSPIAIVAGATDGAIENPTSTDTATNTPNDTPAETYNDGSAGLLIGGIAILVLLVSAGFWFGFRTWKKRKPKKS